MKTEYNPTLDLMKHASKRLQMLAWYTLMEGVEKAFNEAQAILSKAWDGKKWRGNDKQFGEIMANMSRVLVALNRIVPPDFIKKQHEQLTEGYEYYVKFSIHLSMEKIGEANAYFTKYQELNNASIEAIHAVDSALDS